MRGWRWRSGPAEVGPEVAERGTVDLPTGKNSLFRLVLDPTAADVYSQLPFYQ